MNIGKIIIFLIISFISCSGQAYAQKTFIFKNDNNVVMGNQLSILSDQTNKLTLKEILKDSSFTKSLTKIPSAYLSAGKTYWIRFKVKNASLENDLFLLINAPLLNEVEFFKVDSNGNYQVAEDGINFPFNERLMSYPGFVFNLPILPQKEATCFLKIRTTAPLFLPMTIGTSKSLSHFNLMESIRISLYVGVILALFFYNIFIFLTLKEKTYLYYVIYILFIALTQISLFGYIYKYFYPNHPAINQFSIILFPVIAGIAAILFSKSFLEVKIYTPALDKGFNFFIALYLIAFLFALIGSLNVSYRLIDFTALLLVIYATVTAVIILNKGNRSALLYLISFMIFIIAMCIYVFKNLGIIPLNTFTNYILYIGSSFQAILLSFALADKINVYKKEKEISQAQAIQALKEKEEFASQQNVILEKKIYERTDQLQRTNDNLELTLKQLKESQSQLVNAEKMASLGQLTAGIAHEINNPINFVRSNIKPLQLDLEDIKSLLKKYEEMHPDNFSEKIGEIHAFREEIDFEYVMEEIKTLLSGIEDGASRTADIVKGLRTFSRLDESDLKEADIHEGINNTLMLLNHTIPKNISVIRNYQDLPKIECYPGKLNQVFMNLLTNAVQALNSNESGREKKIIIGTERLNDNIIIRIADTGSGIPEDVRKKIFEPFFTTKEVGEGTGLGLSIVYSIIEKHHGQIMVHSEVNNGTEFVITLPSRQSDFLNINANATTSISEESLNHQP